MEQNSAAYYKLPTYRERLWHRLGFSRAHAPRLDVDELKDGWAPSWLMVETFVYLSWADRFRVLISGKLHVDNAIKTDVDVGRSSGTSAVGILPPGAKMGMS